ncbi:hypothetical protein GCM10022403_010740 [Streptomyces coacervatus]|uniref:Uncharacterized protein n=1 Tax=Streptomyces coacervatus TaxID=647381 RepID=A0ABP7GZL8_9ACTN
MGNKPCPSVARDDGGTQGRAPCVRAGVSDHRALTEAVGQYGRSATHRGGHQLSAGPRRSSTDTPNAITAPAALPRSQVHEVDEVSSPGDHDSREQLVERPFREHRPGDQPRRRDPEQLDRHAARRGAP